MYAPILVTVYNRYSHFKKCIESLKMCHDANKTVIFISSDAPKTDIDHDIISKIRNYILSITGFKEVIPVFHPSNQGLVPAMLKTREILFSRFDRLIRLEDDVIVSNDFIKYINEGLNTLKEDQRVYSICSFSHTVFTPNIDIPTNGTYYSNRHNPWGFGIWKDRVFPFEYYTLDEIKKDLRNKSFTRKLNKIGIDLTPAIMNCIRNNSIPSADYLACYHMTKRDLVSLFPNKTKSINIGFDNTGLNCGIDPRFSNLEHLLSIKSDYQINSPSVVNIKNEFVKSFFQKPKYKLKLFLIKIGLFNLAKEMSNFRNLMFTK